MLGRSCPNPDSTPFQRHDPQCPKPRAAVAPVRDRADDGMDGPSGKAKRHQHLRRTQRAVLYQTLCRSASKRGQANDLAFPPSFGGRRVSQRTTPVCAIALFRVSAMFIAKPKGKGPTAGPANNPGPSPLRMRYRRRTRPILRHKCVSPCNFDSHELGIGVQNLGAN